MNSNKNAIYPRRRGANDWVLVQDAGRRDPWADCYKSVYPDRKFASYQDAKDFMNEHGISSIDWAVKAEWKSGQLALKS